jgi:hypothetical protein
MKYFIWLLVISCLGCMGDISHGHHFVYIGETSRQEVAERIIPIWVDRNFGDSDRIAIADAIDQWNYALNGFIQLKIVSWEMEMNDSELKEINQKKGWVLFKITSHNLMVEKKEHGRKNYFIRAFVDTTGGKYLYVVRDRDRNEEIMGLVMHEIGHLLGAEHQNDGGLMTEMYEPDNCLCIDLGTIQQVARAQRLKIDQLNYCQYVSQSQGQEKVKYSLTF